MRVMGWGDNPIAKETAITWLRKRVLVIVESAQVQQILSWAEDTVLGRFEKELVRVRLSSET